MNDNPVTYFAQTDSRNRKTPFGIKKVDRARHVYVIGKTGMGKSTLLENMAVQDIKNGEGMVFIDPHGKTADLLLDYIPKERIKDVLYFAPFDMEYPVSFNVMEDVGPEKRHLVANGLMSAFKKIWVDAWSARMEYILNNILLALLEYPDATLIGVNRMLADKDYRKKVVDNISDPSVKSFWVDEFAKYGERYMQEAGAAIQNKIGQFIANPLVRNIIGQPKSTFDIRKMMDEKKILIVNLSKGQVGEQNANLLGSMMITKIYLAAMSRADTQEAELKKLPFFFMYVDEFQSFANESFADILSEARKYKLALTIAHQYIEQMSEEVRNAVFGNVGTTIAFRVGPFDAEVLEKIFSPQFVAQDIVSLGFAQIYLTLMIDGIGSPPFSAVTLPPIGLPEKSLKKEIIDLSRATFARPRAVVEDEIRKWHAPTQPEHRSDHGPRKEPRSDKPAPRFDHRPMHPEHRHESKPHVRLEPRPEIRPEIQPDKTDGFSSLKELQIETPPVASAPAVQPVSLNDLKKPKPEDKKERSEKNVGALRDALASVMKQHQVAPQPAPTPAPRVHEKPVEHKPAPKHDSKPQTVEQKKDEPQRHSGPQEVSEAVLRETLKVE